MAVSACRTAAIAPGPGAAHLVGLAQGDLGEQRLFRVEVARRGAVDPSFKLVLRLARADRFDLAASDPFGRALWRLGVDGGRGLFWAERGAAACAFDPRMPDALPRLDWGLAALELPPVLLGRLPGSVRERNLAGRSGTATFEDDEGRRWSAEIDALGVVGWTLHRAAGDLRFRRESPGASIADERTGLSVRWRLMTAELLPQPLMPLAPASAAETLCADADFS